MTDFIMPSWDLTPSFIPLQNRERLEKEIASVRQNLARKLSLFLSFWAWWPQKPLLFPVPGADDDDDEREDEGEDGAGDAEDEALEPENLDQEVNYNQRDLVTTVTVTSLGDEDDQGGEKKAQKRTQERNNYEQDEDDGLDIIQRQHRDQTEIPKAKVFIKSTKKEKEIKVGFHYLGKKIE